MKRVNRSDAGSCQARPAGTIASKNGSATMAPAPRRKGPSRYVFASDVGHGLSLLNCWVMFI